MALSGSDKAYRYSLAATARAGASRSGFFQPRVMIDISGTRVESTVIKSSIRLVDRIDEQPSNLRFEMRVTPAVSSLVGQVEGRQITCYLGTTANPIFQGRVLKTSAQVPRRAKRFPRISVDAIDHTWELDFLPFSKLPLATRSWTGVSATSIAKEIIDSCLSPRFRYGAATIERNMAAVDFEVTQREKPSAAFSRLMKAIGGYWYADTSREIYAYTSAAAIGPAAALANTPTQPFWGLQYDTDISQMRSTMGVYGRRTQVKAPGYTNEFNGPWVYVDDVSGIGTMFQNAMLELDQRRTWFVSGTPNATSMAVQLIAFNTAYAPPIGTAVQVVREVTNSSARSLLATRMPEISSIAGITEVLEDTTLSDEATSFVAAGELALFAAPDQVMGYETRDPNAWAGAMVPTSITQPVAVQGTFIIQSAELYGFEGNGLNPMLFPKRRVSAGIFSRNLFDLLSRLRRAQGGA